MTIKEYLKLAVIILIAVIVKIIDVIADAITAIGSAVLRKVWTV